MVNPACRRAVIKAGAIGATALGGREILAAAGVVASSQPWPDPGLGPQAQKIPKDVSIHGDRRIDPYFWLREKNSPQVIEHLQAEAAHTKAWYAPHEGLVDRLYSETLGRIQQTDESAWFRDGSWWYATQTIEGLQYPRLVRRAAIGSKRELDRASPLHILLDLNQLAGGSAFLSVGAALWSPDGRFLAYTVDFTGARDYRLRLRDLDTQKEERWDRQSVSSLAWAGDSRHLFFAAQDESLRADRIFRCSVGKAGSEVLVHREPDKLFNLDLGYSHDRQFLIVYSYAKDTQEQWLIDAKKPLSKARLVLPRQRGREYFAMPFDGGLILRTNDRGPNFRLLYLEGALRSKGRSLVDTKRLEQALELIAHRQDTSIDGFRVFGSHLVVQVRENGLVRLRLRNHQTRQWRDFDFPEPSYQANMFGTGLQLSAETDLPSMNLEYEGEEIRLGYTSLKTPPSVYAIDLNSLSLRVVKQQPVLGGFQPQQLETLRLYAKAHDGSAIPISLVHKASATHAGARPLLLIGYGSYGYPMDPRFNMSALSLLERGVVIAIAHVRGGGDLGRQWYLSGKLENKMNTFTDFIAVAEHLIAQGWTSPGKLIISGASAGGLLMGAVTNLRPELFHAVVAEVPFMDVINTMLDERLPLTTEEFIEWGNPKRAKEYVWLRAYSPYDNIRSGPYPAILARASINDSQVPYWEAAKYVARLRAMKTDKNVLLLDINMNAGHGGSSGRYEAIRERARVHAFMLAHWGLD